MEGPAELSDLDAVVAEGRAGVVLRVRVKPRSRRRGVLGIVGTELSVAVGAAPERGRANAETLETLASWLRLPGSRLRVLSGATSRSKRVVVTGVGPARLRELIREKLRETPR